jgi:hypothetical protein
MKTWIMSAPLSMQASTSSFLIRESPQIRAPVSAAAIAFTAASSSVEEAGNPASMVPTRIAAIWRAISTF